VILSVGQNSVGGAPVKPFKYNSIYPNFEISFEKRHPGLPRGGAVL